MRLKFSDPFCEDFFQNWCKLILSGLSWRKLGSISTLANFWSSFCWHRWHPFSSKFGWRPSPISSCFFLQKNRPFPDGWTLGGFPSSRQAGIVQSTVRLVKQLLTLSPVMFIFQAKASTLGRVCSFWLWDAEDLSTKCLFFHPGLDVAQQ